MKVRELRPHIPEIYDTCDLKILGKDGEVYAIDGMDTTVIANGDDFDTVIYFRLGCLEGGTPFDKYKQPDFEDTCLAIEKAVGDGEIAVEDYDPHIYPDDVDAVMKWVESQAEELHRYET